MIAAALLSLASAIMAGHSAYIAWKCRQAHHAISQRYADALALIVLAARAEPPIAAPELRASCERLLTDHHVTATVISDTIH